MKPISTVLGIAGVAALLAGAPADAHHSFAMYDMEATTTVTGKITRFIPGPNHAQILFALVDADGNELVGDDGNPVIWGIESGPASRIARQGVTVKHFTEGTIVTAELHPLRDGRNFGALSDAGIIHCGTEMPAGGCTVQTGEAFLRQATQ
ncbi:MAG TPA: DUF6152 family protein [Gammaproteobacteria bacterium]|nr:DUF6152 family protein [Gammaproteobacteria bacterium]